MARLVLQRAFEHWRELDEHLRWCDRQVGQHVRASPAAKRAAKVIGIGELGASALMASVGDFKQFKSGQQFGAWLGMVPRQNSSGGKTSLGRITKRGDDYLRTLLIQGAKAAVMTRHKRDDPTSRWLAQLTRARGLAEGLRGHGQQERSHPVGGDDARHQASIHNMSASSRRRHASQTAALVPSHGLTGLTTTQQARRASKMH